VTALQSPGLRVAPRIWIGLAVYVGYVAVVVVVQMLSGVPYTALGDSGENLFRGAGLSLLVGAALLIVVTSGLGWWHPAMNERRPAVHRWPIAAPAIMAIGLGLNLGSTDWGSFDAAFLSASIVLILVGFTEELTTRGLLLVGLRSRLREVWVWLITSALFAVMHFANALAGQDLAATLQQVAFAFGGGTIFYILRRTTGSLLWAMLLHGLWDFSTFSVAHGEPGPFAGVGFFVYTLAVVVALAGVTVVIRGADESTAPRR
jgi:uncharacterized protein